MTIPYIGITDFDTYSQVKNMLDIYVSLARKKQKRKLMIGVMMNYKTLHGMETKWSNVWPTREWIGGIFQPHPFACNTLHYADFDNRTTANDLERAIAFANSHDGLDALQLDMPWPDTEMIIRGTAEFLKSGKKLPIILQIGGVAMKQCGDDFNQVVLKLDEYQDLVDYVLLDMSGGKDIPMNTDLMRSRIRAITGRYGNTFAITVAGGLGPDTMDLIRPLLGEFPDISIDAQGKLHINDDALQPIDPKKQEAYLRRAVPMFP